MLIRWRKENGNWAAWRDVDKTKTFLPEEVKEFQIAETMTKIDAMVMFPGLFASLRKDYKKYKKQFDKLSKDLDLAREMSDKKAEEDIKKEMAAIGNILAGKKAAVIQRSIDEN